MSSFFTGFATVLYVDTYLEVPLIARPPPLRRYIHPKIWYNEDDIFYSDEMITSGRLNLTYRIFHEYDDWQLRSF